MRGWAQLQRLSWLLLSQLLPSRLLLFRLMWLVDSSMPRQATAV